MAAVVMLLVGCSGGGGNGGQKPEGQERTATTGAAPTEERKPRVEVPAAFDGTKGWAVESSEGLSRPVYAPRTKEVLFLKNARDGRSTQVVARDLRTGVVRWTGAPVELPVSGQDGSVDGEVTLLVTSKGETDYAVVKFSGETGGDGASKSRDITRLTVFPAGGSGEVEAGRTFEFPHKREFFAAQDSGGVIVANWSAGQQGAIRRYEVRDPGTGKVRVTVRCEGKPVDADAGRPRRPGPAAATSTRARRAGPAREQGLLLRGHRGPQQGHVHVR
ncbi:hypothetical protein ACFWPY_39750 [Streptomyces sp. NPDC058527]|uniref:hypothetical protein n=1 Tax=Streptomyces sp. NPDC058527 TaxID=3346539 RepID=UPI0036559B83